MNVKRFMKVRKYRGAGAIFVFVLLVFLCRISSNIRADEIRSDSGLKIYLPREVAIKGSAIKLGRVCIIQGDNLLESKAEDIPMGRISVPGQKIVIDRPVVLSRLASNGIPASKVRFTGAKEITVSRQEKIIKGVEFVELASEFLKKNSADNICQIDPVLIPKDFIISRDNKELEFTPCLIESHSTSLAKVLIVISQDGRQIDSRKVAFRLKYNSRRAVASVDIPAGEVISPENIKVEDTISDYPQSDKWKPPYGQITKRRIPADTVVLNRMISPFKSEVIVKRNQNIVIRLERPGLMVTAIGKALQEARSGEYIKVRNIDSQRIILARVNDDGTVAPVF